MTTKERLDKHDRQIAAIRTLIQQGMRLVVDLAAAQKRTEASLEKLITGMRGGNGHKGRNTR